MPINGASNRDCYDTAEFSCPHEIENEEDFVLPAVNFLLKQETAQSY